MESVDVSRVQKRACEFRYQFLQFLTADYATKMELDFVYLLTLLIVCVNSSTVVEPSKPNT